MSINTEMPRHLEDHELVGVMDQVGTDADRGDWETHLSTCLPCAERLEELRTSSNWLHQNIVLLDQDVQVDELARARAMAAAKRTAKRQSQSFSWAGLGRAAAVVALVGAIGFTADPVRAWFLEWTGLGADEPVEVAAPAPVAPRGAMVTFAPTERLFTIELEQPQTDGVLRVTLTDEDFATAQVVNGAEESFSVLPAALLISNLQGSAASYEVNLPVEMVRSVRLVVGGETVSEVPVEPGTGPVTLDLAPNGGA